MKTTSNSFIRAKDNEVKSTATRVKEKELALQERIGSTGSKRQTHTQTHTQSRDRAIGFHTSNVRIPLGVLGDCCHYTCHQRVSKGSENDRPCQHASKPLGIWVNGNITQTMRRIEANIRRHRFMPRALHAQYSEHEVIRHPASADRITHHQGNTPPE